MNQHHLTKIPGYKLKEPILLLVGKAELKEDAGVRAIYGSPSLPHYLEAPAFKAYGAGHNEEMARASLIADITRMCHLVDYCVQEGWQLPHMLYSVGDAMYDMFDWENATVWRRFRSGRWEYGHRVGGPGEWEEYKRSLK